MKPWLIVTGDFVRSGGMDRANYALASYLAEQGVETHLVAYQVDPELDSCSNLIVHRVAKPFGSYSLSGPLLARVGRFWASKIAARGGRVVVNGGNCNWADVNWAHHVQASYRPETPLGVLRRFKTAIQYRLARANERRIIPQARHVIVGSDRTGCDLIRWLGVRANRIHLVPYGVDPNLFRPATDPERAVLRASLAWPDGRPVIAFVGAMGDRRKGFDTVFAAWKKLRQDKSWDADLVVVGAGAELPAWEQRTADARLESRIHFLGFNSAPDFVANVLRACDALVAPSRYEGYGLAVHEAICCGIPAFVSVVAPVARRYPSELCDLLIPDPDDADNLARQLRRWCFSRDSYRTAVTPFSAELRRRTWDDMAANFVELVETTE